MCKTQAKKIDFVVYCIRAFVSRWRCGGKRRGGRGKEQENILFIKSISNDHQSRLSILLSFFIILSVCMRDDAICLAIDVNW